MDTTRESNKSNSLLTVTAEIISEFDEGFQIKLHNDETDEVLSVKTVDEYADYIISNANNSKKDDFKAIWLPSPYARKEDIDFIGTKLGEIQKRFDTEIEVKEG
ncbi:MAG: hypothetical protein HF962_08555 [Sulfurovum sp.]|nr:hypothetical protein [Sulfurovum sp.]